jgi:hypothetical protein
MADSIYRVRYAATGQWSGNLLIGRDYGSDEYVAEYVPRPFGGTATISRDGITFTAKEGGKIFPPYATEEKSLEVAKNYFEQVRGGELVVDDESDGDI